MATRRVLREGTRSGPQVRYSRITPGAGWPDACASARRRGTVAVDDWRRCIWFLHEPCFRSHLASSCSIGRRSDNGRDLAANGLMHLRGRFHQPHRKSSDRCGAARPFSAISIDRECGSSRLPFHLSDRRPPCDTRQVDTEVRGWDTHDQQMSRSPQRHAPFCPHLPSKSARIVVSCAV